MMIIYKTTNLKNNKFYVGQHYTSADDGYLGSGKILKRAFNKYGKESFKRETLEFVDENNINEKEIYWIAQLSATVEYGNYNIMKGGEKPPTGKGIHNNMFGKKHKPETILKMSKAKKGFKHSDEFKKNISKRMKGKNHWNYGKRGKKTSEQIKKKISNSMKKLFIYKKHWNYGIRLSNKHIIKIRKNQKNSKTIIINDNIYQSIRDASRILDIGRKTITGRLKNKNFPNYRYV